MRKILLYPNSDKPEPKRFHAKAQRRKDNLQPIRNPRNATFHQGSPKIDEKRQPHHS
jgi:hypothetical protein